MQISNEVVVDDESLNDRMLVHEDPFAVRNEKCVQTEDSGPGDHESASCLDHSSIIEELSVYIRCTSGQF